MRIDWTAALAELDAHMETVGVSVKFKEDSKVQRLVGFLMKPFNPRYMTTFITTFGTTVWWPRERWESTGDRRKFATMAHEVQHVVDRKRHPVAFPVGYVAPQAFAILALLAFGAFWHWEWVTALLFLLALVPGIHSAGRTKWELRAYRISYALKCLEAEEVLQSKTAWFVETFVGPSYYYMAPKEQADNLHQDLVDAGRQAVLQQDQPGTPWFNEVMHMAARHAV